MHAFFRRTKFIHQSCQSGTFRRLEVIGYWPLDLLAKHHSCLHADFQELR